MRLISTRFWELGHEIIGTWLHETKRPEHIPSDIFKRKLAFKDVAEVYAADLVILDNRRSSGGKNCEWGVGMAHFQNKLLYLVGEPSNVFHELADKQFASWDECFSYTQVHHREPKHLAYLAGLLDGEGCVTLTKRRSSVEPVIKVALTVKTPLELLHSYYGGNFTYYAEKANPKWKPSWTWSLYSPDTIKLCLKELGELLLVKKAQADLMLRFLGERTLYTGPSKIPSTETKLRLSYFREMKQLNQRGIIA